VRRRILAHINEEEDTYILKSIFESDSPSLSLSLSLTHTHTHTHAHKHTNTCKARFVFAASGGGSLKILQMAGIPEISGYGVQKQIFCNFV
jgi:hypothetical protein